MNRPRILFAHGAGAGSASDWMQRWAARLDAVGDVEAFDYPYMQAGRRAPDRFPKLLEAHRAALHTANAAGRHQRVVLAGKSMGSRIGCHLALEEPVAAVICFGYPLMPLGRPDKIRDEVLLRQLLPVLFLQGRRDRMCPFDALADVRPQMRARSELFVVDGGDHSLTLSKTAMKQRGITQEESDAEVFAALSTFLADVLS